MLGYAAYNYAYYLFGAAVNWFFPVYVLLFTAPVFALILALGRLDARAVAAGALLLLRRRAWGYVIAAIIGIKGATYTLVLTAGSAVGAARGIDGTAEQIPVWGLWTLAGLLAVWGLLRGVRAPARPSA